MKKICIISEFYPYKDEPRFPFVQQLAYSMSNEDVECVVIAPQSITRNIIRKTPIKPVETIDVSPDKKNIKVIRPWIITFSNSKNIFLQWLADKIMENAIKRGVKKEMRNLDAIYCYFWHVGLMTSEALKKYNIPIYIQASECELTIHTYMKKKCYIDRVKHVICASNKNRIESIEAGLTQIDKTTIVPNGYRNDEFYPIPKNVCRKKLNYAPDKFIVVFLGGFIERKGIRQLVSVLNRFDDVYSIFIGQGEEPPTCKNILFCDKLEHNEIVDYLNCGDVFVLPTKAEGCCNAIIEALACGLPVISSNKSFNDEILNDRCSIRIDESNEEELYNAIELLKKDKDLRKKMSSAALEKAKMLTIEHRAKAIRKLIFKE